jgi:hypothetical protein
MVPEKNLPRGRDLVDMHKEEERLTMKEERRRS